MASPSPWLHQCGPLARHQCLAGCLSAKSCRVTSLVCHLLTQMKNWEGRGTVARTRNQLPAAKFKTRLLVNWKSSLIYVLSSLVSWNVTYKCFIEESKSQVSINFNRFCIPFRLWLLIFFEHTNLCSFSMIFYSLRVVFFICFYIPMKLINIKKFQKYYDYDGVFGEWA